MAQVSLDAKARRRFDGEAIARTIARSTGAPLSRVTIVDERIQVIFDGGGTATELAAGPSTHTTSGTPLDPPVAATRTAPPNK